MTILDWKWWRQLMHTATLQYAPVWGANSSKRLSTCPQILMIQKAFLQSFTFYELISVIKLMGFSYFYWDHVLRPCRRGGAKIEVIGLPNKKNHRFADQKNIKQIYYTVSPCMKSFFTNNNQNTQQHKTITTRTRNRKYHCTHAYWQPTGNHSNEK